MRTVKPFLSAICTASSTVSGPFCPASALRRLRPNQMGNLLGLLVFGLIEHLAEVVEERSGGIDLEDHEPMVRRVLHDQQLVALLYAHFGSSVGGDDDLPPLAD